MYKYDISNTWGLNCHYCTKTLHSPNVWAHSDMFIHQYSRFSEKQDLFGVKCFKNSVMVEWEPSTYKSGPANSGMSLRKSFSVGIPCWTNTSI